MISNNARVARGLYLLRLGLDSYVSRQFTSRYADRTAPALEEILGAARDEQRPFLNMKAQDLLAVMQGAWAEVFAESLSGIEPSLIRELAFAHETWANRQSFTDEAAYQTLDRVQRLLAAIAAPTIGELERLKLECLESEEPAVAPAAPPPSPVIRLADPPAPPPPAPAPATAPASEPPATAPVSAAPYLADLLQALREFSALQEADRVDAVTQEEIEPVYADAAGLRELLGTFLPDLGDIAVDRFCQYQADALEKSLAGADAAAGVALETPPGVAKTPALALSMAAALRQNPGGHALLICPAPAVSAGRLARLNAALAPAGLTAAALDATAGETEAREIRANPPAVLLTTPEIANRSLLAHPEDWPGFLENLRFVALEDAHQYRGYFGSQMALLLRRLEHYLARVGATPRYLVAAAGPDFLEQAQNLTGRELYPAAAAGAPSPRRHYLSVNPVNPSSNPAGGNSPDADSLPQRIANAALACVHLERPALVLCPTEELAQACWQAARRAAADRGLNPEHFGLAPADVGVASESGGDAAAQLSRFKAVFAAPTPETSPAAAWAEGVILAGFSATVQAAWRIAAQEERDSGREFFTLLYGAEDTPAPVSAADLPALLSAGWPGAPADPGNLAAIRAHLPALVQEADGRVYSFTAAALGETVFQVLCREGANLPLNNNFPQGRIELRGE